MRLPDARSPLPPIGALSGSGVRLFLVSATLLFVELLLIRWVPANVVYVGYFSNFLLMASFLGIGLGILLGRAGRRLPLSPFAPLFLGVFALVVGAQLNVKLTSSDEIFYGIESSHSADVNFVVLPLIVVLVVALMAALALPLGPLLRSMPPLRAYAVDIAGSLAGIAGFTLLSASAVDPVAWFAIAGGLLLLQALGIGPTLWSVVGGACLLAVVAVAWQLYTGSGDVWSPYYRITTYDRDLQRTSARPGSNDRSYVIHANGIAHQAMIGAAGAANQPMYGQVYRWFPDRRFARVAILGAGSGTDTTLALARGAEHVDAVEIDPEIARIGTAFHPDRPYDDPRVNLIVNDGRAFLRNSTDSYDLIIFALTDSLTLASTSANLRLESFLYTQQAFESARDRLTPDGVLVLYNVYREPWLVTKLGSMLSAAFGSPPIARLWSQTEAVLAHGPGVRTAAAAGTLGDTIDPLPSVGAPDPRPSTDDWPFLYLRTPAIAPYYLFALAFVLLLAVVSVVGATRVAGIPLSGFSPHFFALGVAFLLLETRSLVSFSLLFGSTWLVNSLTFFAILASVLLAIAVNAVRPIRQTRPLYVALFAALGVAFLLPPESLLVDPPALRYALAASVAFAPVFFANLVFTHSFRDTRRADMAFASNLLGATVGGVLEYVSLLTGYRLLLVVVALAYAAAYVLASQRRFLGDEELGVGPGAHPAEPAVAG